MRVDLHVHTNASGDGKNTPVEMIAAAKRAGLGAIAITDHNTVEGWRNLKLSNGFVIIPGVELDTDKGHVLVLGIEDVPPTKELIPLLEWAKDHNAIAIAAHIYDLPNRSPMGSYAFNHFRIIEGINGKCPARLCRKVVRDAFRHKVKFVCNSDAHHVSELGAFYNNVPGETLEELLENIRKEHFEPRIHFPSPLDFVTRRLRLPLGRRR
ncbi:MAG TPA: PHP domain-containing protein [archaeon]|nr:PHP domain-containing protein [archaeon]